MTTVRFRWWKVMDGGNVHATEKIRSGVALCNRQVEPMNAIGEGFAIDTVGCERCRTVLYNWTGTSGPEPRETEGKEAIVATTQKQRTKQPGTDQAARTARSRRTKTEIQASPTTTAQDEAKVETATTQAADVLAAAEKNGAKKATSKPAPKPKPAAKPNPRKDVPDGTRLCGRCKTVKPMDAFPLRKSGPNAGKPVGWCAECQVAYRVERKAEAQAAKVAS